ncbi:hypothetical protein ABE237_15755 [Brevibacillus formosus]|uniref:hypothetical protein n=1 Tax=Brevibacillus formosus TaxID=54913 RepID=UPI0018CDA969|nr:hypothetical protein [Brevibacillus formosus]MBG9943908.1 hypothetical protein [Brevibacillus formosus]
MPKILSLPTERSLFADQASELIKRNQKSVVIVMDDNGVIEVGAFGCSHFETVSMMEYGKLTFASNEK